MRCFWKSHPRKNLYHWCYPHFGTPWDFSIHFIKSHVNRKRYLLGTYDWGREWFFLRKIGNILSLKKELRTFQNFHGILNFFGRSHSLGALYCCWGIFGDTLLMPWYREMQFIRAILQNDKTNSMPIFR